MPLHDVVRRHPTASFVAIGCAISCGWWVSFVLRGDTVRQGDPWPTESIGLLGPAVGAIVVTGGVDGRDGPRHLLRRMVKGHLPLSFLADSFRGLGFILVGRAIGLVCGSLVSTWRCDRAGHGILVVALWHSSYSFASATDAMEGVPAAVTSAGVMLLAVLVATRAPSVLRRQGQGVNRATGVIR
ncbi:MAG TPA: hypothetical protein VFI99_04660 [Nocardioides sp.]|jgi:hypothetical protein|nr:hypothetical protein [Nocardioides sp.]